MAKYYEDEYEDERPRKKSSSGSGNRNSGKRPAGKKGSGKKSSKKQQAKKQRTRIIIFVIEIIILVVAVFVLYAVMSATTSGKVKIDEGDIIINDTVKKAEETTMKGYRNIALFGVDSTSGALTKNTRSDTIMIASINQDTGECKLVSVYRDTYLNLSNDSYNKCNAAYAKGGPEMAISMLNMNLDMNITDFVTVGFAGLTDTIDALGGVYIDVDDAEINHLNNYQLCIAEDLKRSYTPVSSTGYQLLDGLQATGYCRIRYTAGDDFKRAERQREVLSAVADQAKKASLPALTETANSVFDEVYTSLDLSEIVEMLGNVGNYYIADNAGFPQESNRATGTIGSKGSCVVPVSLEDNVKWLHQFLFNDYEYQPSATVKECSDKIYSDTNGYLKK
ncbi:MAG: LytR family transcriptional regulator [Lachnospiraceae bacterium]|nr:LytR family transcriptional regulator [Lachnospiraceae bacterium]MBD5504936.1 LytR family transcriptional regulator [Lachnospiraceae bacterium]